MRWTALRWLALLGLVSGTVASAQDSAIEALDTCLASFGRGDVEGGFGLKQIETNCPDLKTTLEHSPYAAWFPEDWWGLTLSTGSLLELRDHMELASKAREPRSLDTTGVTTALDSLEDDLQASQVTWWDRLLEWLRSRLRPEAEEPPTWLFKWLDEFSRHQTAVRIIGYTLFGLVVLAAVWIVINEFRAAGVFGARRQRRSRSAAMLAAAGPTQGLTLSDIDGSDPLSRPSLLLALLLAALAKRENRIVGASVTHRELAQRVVLDDSSLRSAFGRLIRCAERVRYAATVPSRSEIDEVVVDARRLLESIAASPRTSPA